MPAAPPTAARLASLPLLAVPALARAESGVVGAAVPVFIVGTVFGVTALIVGMVLYAVLRTHRLRHETLRHAIERGAPLPPELLGAGRSDPHRDLRRGLLLLGFGAGLAIFLRTVTGAAETGVWTLGFVPGLLGVGYLVTWAVTRRARAGGAAPDVA